MKIKNNMQSEKTIQFLKKLKESGNWNDNYDYSEVNYISNRDKIIIIDQYNIKHLITPSNILKGTNLNITNSLDKNLYLKNKFQEIHKNKYDYSKINYVNNETLVEIICPEHGVFEQTPNTHTSGSGCPKCGIIRNGDSKRKNINDFIKESNVSHNNKYDYSLVKYKNSTTKVKIICPEHGEFEQTPSKHINGQGCVRCSKINNIEDFIKKSNDIHRGKYNYSLVEYKNSTTKVKIICPEHGEFEQSPNTHHNGGGCIKCYGNQNTTIEEFISRSNKIHQSKYNYSKSEYKNSHTKLTIICPEHGEFDLLGNCPSITSKSFKWERMLYMQ
jgi:hypothetical protein